MGKARLRRSNHSTTIRSQDLQPDNDHEEEEEDNEEDKEHGEEHEEDKDNCDKVCFDLKCSEVRRCKQQGSLSQAEV